MTARPPFDAAGEDRIVADMTRELELMTSGTPVSPDESLADRIMAAIHDEPLPQPVRAFGLALVAGRLRAAGSAIGDSWRVATSGFAPACSSSVNHAARANGPRPANANPCRTLTVS